MKKASELLQESAGPFDSACMMVKDMETQIDKLMEDNIGLKYALTAIYQLYGEDKQIADIVNEALRKHAI